jgi:hypothetical protein
MKQIAVGKLHIGEQFAVAGHQYIVLDRIGPGVLSIEADQLGCRPFGKKNDFRTSSIREYLHGEYLDELAEIRGSILPMTIDLKETNGGREYGYHSCDVGMLTLEQYIKYAEHIPLASDWWWLATPWGTPDSRSPNTSGSSNAWRVCAGGVVSSNSSSGASIGVRPALLFASDLLVSIEAPTVELSDEDIEAFGKTIGQRVLDEMPEGTVKELADAIGGFCKALAEKFRSAL